MSMTKLEYKDKMAATLSYCRRKCVVIAVAKWHNIFFFIKYENLPPLSFFIWFVRLLSLRPLLAYCSSLG
jgi:hypothetical protein